MSIIKARENVMTIAPYVGGDVTPNGMTRRIVLASNESPLGPSPLVVDFFKNFSLPLASYPSGSASALKEALAALYHVDLSHVICGNGSEDIIHLICRAFVGEGDDVVIPQYGFLVYPIATKASGAHCVFVPQIGLRSDVDAIVNAMTSRTKVVFLDNPGNPLGCLMQREDVMRLHQNLPESVLLVLDEAYAEYVTDPEFESGLSLFKRTPNVIVLRTFSKAYGLASLRIGWAHAAPHLLDPLNRIRQPFNVNSIAQAVGCIALQDQQWIEKAREHNHIWRSWTKRKLETAGFKVNPSYGNFLLFDCGSMDKAQQLYSDLGERGITLRPVGGYGLHQHLRVSVGKDTEMEEFIHVLNTFNSVECHKRTSSP